MTNPTRQEIIEAQLARQWAEWNKSCEVSSPEIQAAANFILAHTTPLTIADVEWDDELHYLAEAEHSAWGKVIMLNRAFTSGDIRALINEDGAISIGRITPKYLTPTGKRYTLTEV